MKRIILGCILVCLFISCNSIKQISSKNSTKINYKNINKDSEIYRGCIIIIHRDIKTNNLLNGKYEVNYKGGKIEFATFLNGKYDGFVETYKKGSLVNIIEYKKGLKNGMQIEYSSSYSQDKDKEILNQTITNYKDGLINGIQKLYSDNILYEEKTFINSIQEGNNYIFNNKGDTLDIITYSPIKPLEDKYKVLNHKEYDNRYPYKGKIKVHSKNQTISEILLVNSVDLGIDDCCLEKLKGAYLFSTKSDDFVFCFGSLSLPEKIFKLD